MATPTQTDLNNLKADCTHMAEIATGRVGGEAGGANIDTSTDRLGQVKKTAQKVLSELGDLSYKVDKINPTSTGTMTHNGGPATFSETVQVGNNMSAYGALNVSRSSASPQTTITLGDGATPANDVGIYFRQNAGLAGFSTVGAGFAWYTGSPGFGKVMELTESGNLLVGVASGSNHILEKGVAEGNNVLSVRGTGLDGITVRACANGGYSGSQSAVFVAKNSVSGRSINAAGTINASGADYAEYERNNGATIAKGDIVGFDADGVLTTKFDDALSFGVKSTDPCMVGGDVWGTEDQVGKRPEQPQFVAPESAGDLEAAKAEFNKVTIPAYEKALAAFEAKLEAARQQVDRVAYSGKVPVNVWDSKPGDYIVAVSADDGGIAGVAVGEDEISFAQYRKAVGRVRRIEPDGRALIAVIVH